MYLLKENREKSLLRNSMDAVPPGRISWAIFRITVSSFSTCGRTPIATSPSNCPPLRTCAYVTGSVMSPTNRCSGSRGLHFSGAYDGGRLREGQRAYHARASSMMAGSGAVETSSG